MTLLFICSMLGLLLSGCSFTYFFIPKLDTTTWVVALNAGWSGLTGIGPPLIGLYAGVTSENAEQLHIPPWTLLYGEIIGLVAGLALAFLRIKWRQRRRLGEIPMAAVEHTK